MVIRTVPTPPQPHPPQNVLAAVAPAEIAPAEIAPAEIAPPGESEPGELDEAVPPVPDEEANTGAAAGAARAAGVAGHGSRSHHHRQHTKKVEAKEDLRLEIHDLLNKEYMKDTHGLVRGRASWRFTGEVCEALAKVFGGASSIVSFAASSYNSQTLAFSAGCISTSALVLMLFSNYATREAKERTQQLNMVLGAVGVTQVPNIALMSTTAAVADPSSASMV